MKIALVAAVARGAVIGRAGTLPWRLPEDMTHFRDVTMGHPVVMGRRTWDSLPDRFRPLPGRRNIVVTRNADWTADGSERASSLEDALRLLDGEQRVFVIGGGEIFAAALPLADELLLTEIDAEIEGDTFFPTFAAAEFEEIAREPHVSESGLPFSFVTYARRQSSSTDELASQQLSAIGEVDALFERAGVAYWLIGGWAVDFHAGSITRAHDDVDIAVWLDDLPRISALLDKDEWSHAPSPHDDGGTGYERGPVRLELTFLARDGERTVIPLRELRVQLPDGSFADDVRELLGVRSRIIGLAQLAGGKASPRDDPHEAAKDRADFEILARL